MLRRLLTTHISLVVLVLLQSSTTVAFLAAPHPSRVIAHCQPQHPRNILTSSGSALSNDKLPSPMTSSSDKSSSLPAVVASSTRLFQQPPGKKQVSADGTGRGAYLLGIVLLACLWVFSIPPEFRRAYLCGSERCEQDRTAYLCNDCITTKEWREGIMDYYRSGGGIQFDFSIDPNSKMKF